MQPGDSISQQIVFAVIGSLGDLHPCLALALELKRRGHHVTIATTSHYRTRIEGTDLSFYPMRPNWDPTDHDLIAQCEHPKRGVEVLFRNIILPHLADTYQDLLACVINLRANILIAGEMVYAAPLVSEKLALPWVSIILSPASFLSAHDPSVTANVPSLIHIRKFGWPSYRAALNLGRLLTRHWWNPVRALRRTQQLSPACDPLFKDKFSPWLTLVLFSPDFARPQPDWPSHTLQPGFLFYDHLENKNSLTVEAAQFLAAGSSPIIFTLGSTAVHNPGNFYEQSAAAAESLGHRAILVGPKNVIGTDAYRTGLLSLPYAAYAEIFPFASVIVHQGGSGTTAEAMRAGRPMLIVPYGWDQPDNGARIQRLGLGLCLPRARYKAENIVKALRRLLTETAFATKSAIMAASMKNQNALNEAASAIEEVLAQNIQP